MIKRTNLFIFLLIPVVFLGQGVIFENSLKTTFEKAQKENKPVFIEYYNSTCTICKSITPLFDDPKMADFYNANFISYKINTHGGLQKDEEYFMEQARIHFSGVPYFMFFDKNKNFIHYSGAKADVDYLIKIGQTALDPNQRTGSLESKYESGDRSIKTLYAYTDLLQLYKDEKKTNLISDELYQVYPKERLGTHQSYLILKNAVFDIENGFFKYWYSNRENLIGIEKGKQSGEEYKILERIVLNSLRSTEKLSWNTSKINQVKSIISTLKISDNPDVFLWEAECAALVREDRADETLKKMNQLLQENENNIFSSIYIVQFTQDLLKEKQHLEIVKKAIDRLKNKETKPEQMGDLMILETNYFKQIHDKINYNHAKHRTQTYFEKHELDISLLNNL